MKMFCNLMWLYGNEGFKTLAQSRFLLKSSEHIIATSDLGYSFTTVHSSLYFDLPCLSSTNHRFSIHFLPLRGVGRSGGSAVVDGCFSDAERP